MKTFGYIVAVVVLLLLLNRIRVNRMLQTKKLSDNFALSEFVTTYTGFENIPEENHIVNLTRLVHNVLQPLRNSLGVPVFIRSGFRSERVNAVVGGADNSQHMTGEAADIEVRGMSSTELARKIKALNLQYDQLIDERIGSSAWVHVSISETPRREALIATRSGGKTSYSALT